MSDETAGTRALLTSFLGGPGSDSGWSLLAPRIHAPDDLSPLERTLLPLAFERWRQDGRAIDSMHVLRGIHRKTVVRNRLFLLESARSLAALRAAGVDALVFKSGGLLGRLLPDTGLRPIADIDLWVRPSQIRAATRALGTAGASPGEDHAVTIEIASGLQLDLHSLPSHIHTSRLATAASAEALFDSAWAQREDGALSAADLLYFSFLNPLYSHPPGGARAAFALLELAAALGALPVTDDVLQGVLRRVQDDGSAAVFLEHASWLGPGVSPAIDRFIATAVQPAATPHDIELALRLSRQARNTAGLSVHQRWLRTHARGEALASRRMPGGTPATYSGVARHFLGVMRRNPRMLLVWAGRPSSWRRLWHIGRHVAGADS
ncbi:hypothetical protein DK847_05665 [Aestuariivirga litoralis]|uniref:Nucleotidyltransferase family protein n=1 Tax=Aestuariivirga litoralis TaxID=2650924 RepID=A0A2W2ARG0_9HYPH|nr:nucleotidyltransferase family protein [Aestuariivirga litoralis]PZF77915.1 hypothetical protein DK847_05665 [Aestuariivirga litoralis]